MSTNSYLDEDSSWYKHAFETTNQFIAILDATLSIQIANKALLDLLELDLDSVVGIPYWDLSLWAHSEEIQNLIMFSIEQMYFGEEVKFETSYKSKDSEIKYLEFSIKPIHQENGEIETIIAMGYDVTSIKQAEKELHKTEKELEVFFETGIDGYIIRTLEEPLEINYDNAKKMFENTFFKEVTIKYNKSFEEMLEIPKMFYDGKDLFNNSKLYIKYDELLEYFNEAMLKGYKRFEKSFITKNKTKRYVEISIVPIITEGFYIGSFYTFSDITTAKMYQEQLFKMANFDPLTSVANRRYFISNVKSYMADESFDKGIMCVFDIDNFKMVNDTFGHDIGDVALKKISSVINDIVKDYGIFARLGGEEFGAFLRCDVPTGKSILDDIFTEVRETSITIDNRLVTLKITVSAGISIVNKGEKFNDFFKLADQSLYNAKNSGRNRYCISED